MSLHLLPNLLAPNSDPAMNFVPGLTDIVNGLDGFFVENPKLARVFLKHFDFDKLRDKPMVVIHKQQITEELMAPVIKDKENWGIITDAGLPCMADPGYRLVAIANKNSTKTGIKVHAYPGPCSIILALMLSGLPSQSFTFNGYLPRKLDRKFRIPGTTQIYIETPYRNIPSIRALTENLRPTDFLCIACDLQLPTQQVLTKPISWWLTQNYDHYHKRPLILITHTP